MLESQFQKKVIDYLKKNKVYNFKTIRTNRNGIPDIIICHQSKFIAIELKADKNTLSGNQVLEKERIENAGGIFIELRNTYEWKEILNERLCLQT